MRQNITWAVLLAACGLALGCEQFPEIGQRVGLNTPPAPPYRELVERYNANIKHLDQIWSRATVEMRWRDEDKGMRTEQGDSSQVMAVLPDRLAVSVGKLGNALAWIGCDENRYWFIDLSADPKRAYVGAHESYDHHIASNNALMVRPHDVPRVAGWVALPTSPAGKVRVEDGAYIIEPPRSDMRIAIDPSTAMPKQIEILDRRGKLMVRSRLSRPDRVETDGRPIGAWPRINTVIELTSPATEGWLRIHLSDMTDARGKGDSSKQRAMKRAFDFDYLVKAMRVQRVDDLDRGDRDFGRRPLRPAVPVQPGHEGHNHGPIVPEAEPYRPVEPAESYENAEPYEPAEPVQPGDGWYKPDRIIITPDDGTSRGRRITIQ